MGFGSPPLVTASSSVGTLAKGGYHFHNTDFLKLAAVPRLNREIEVILAAAGEGQFFTALALSLGLGAAGRGPGFDQSGSGVGDGAGGVAEAEGSAPFKTQLDTVCVPLWCT